MLYLQSAASLVEALLHLSRAEISPAFHLSNLSATMGHMRLCNFIHRIATVSTYTSQDAGQSASRLTYPILLLVSSMKLAPDARENVFVGISEESDRVRKSRYIGMS